MTAGQTVVLAVTDHPSVPTAADAVVLNAVAVDPSTAGFVSLTTCDHGSAEPATSSVNFRAGNTTANSSIVPLTDGGDVCIFASAPTDVVVDVTGWLGESGRSTLDLVPGTRVVDSRDGTGGVTRLVPGRAVTVDLRGHVSPAADAAGVNLTVTRPAGAGFVAAFPCERGWDGNSSAINHGAGEDRANNAIVALDPAQTFCLIASTATDVIVDLTAEFGPNGLTFVPVRPTRLLDTRTGGALLAADAEVPYPVPQAPGSPRPPPAASVVITAVGHAAGGFVTSWACGPRPATSTLNPRPLEANANGAIVPVGSDGRSCLYTLNPTNLLVDIGGWWI